MKKWSLMLAALLVFTAGCSGYKESTSDIVDEIVDTAADAIAVGDYQTAIDELSDAADLDATDPDVVALQVDAYSARAGATTEALAAALDTGDGTPAVTVANVMTQVNYSDADEFAVRSLDTSKALDLAVSAAAGGDVTTLDTETKVKASTLAATSTAQSVTKALDGESPTNLSDAEIATKVSANYAAIAGDLNKAANIAVTLRADLLSSLVANPAAALAVKAAVSTDIVDIDAYLAQYGLDDGNVSEAELIALLQSLN